MGDNILEGLASSVPSVNLDQFITDQGWAQLSNINPPVSISMYNNDNQNYQSNDVIYTKSLNLASDINSTANVETLVTGSALNTGKSPSIRVEIENRMVRFRYDSELNNRNFGKEVLAKILVFDFIGKVKIRIHAVDDKKYKAHPFCLIGDKCCDGVYLEEHDVTPEKNECICKATPRIPKQKDYEQELKKRKDFIKDPSRFPFITPEMDKEDYWSSNKNIKESKEIILMVEVIFCGQNMENAGYTAQHTEPINNAKDGKKFDVHAISPTTSSVLGSSNDSHFIILTADSYSPNESDIEVRFTDDGNWSHYIAGKVIKNAIEFNFPGYDESISVEKTIWVTVYDKKRKIETSKKPLLLRPTDNDIIALKRKKVMPFSIPDDYLENVKKEEVQPSSCRVEQRKIHRVKRRVPGGSGTASSTINVVNLDEGNSFNVSSPASNTSSASSTSFSQHDLSVKTSDFNNTLSNPAMLLPSGSREIPLNASIFGTATLQNHSGMNSTTQNDILLTLSTQHFQISNQSVSMNTQAVTSSSANTQPITSSSANTTDLAQQLTNSLGSMSLQAQLEILKLLGLTAEGAITPNNYTQNQYSNSGYDPHDIRLEDLMDDFTPNDVEVDGEVSSSTEVKNSKVGGDKCGKKKENRDKVDCDKCDKKKEKCEKKPEKECQVVKDKTDDKITKSTPGKDFESIDNKADKKIKSTSQKDAESNDNKTAIQSAVVSSNVDSDVEEG